MNQRQQIKRRNAERHADLGYPVAWDVAGSTPVEDGRAGHAQQLTKLDGAASHLDQNADAQTLRSHGAHGRLFRLSLSSPIVDEIDTSRRNFRQSQVMDLKAIGKRVRQLRDEVGEVQEDLAAAVGVTRPTIAGIENGKDQGGLKTMVAIADYYKVPLDWLLCREVPPGGPAIGKFIDRPDQIAWSNFWDGLTAPERCAVVSLLRIPRPGDTG